MAWLLVVIAGCFEVGFALLLKESNGFTKLWPTIGFAVCALASFGLLNISLRDLPIGTAYAVWTGIGAAGTALFGILLQGDPHTVLRITSIALVIAGVIGLQLSGLEGGH